MGTRASATVFWFAAILFVSLFSPGRPVHALTLSFELGQGTNQWGYFQYGQLGRNGFFGTYDIDSSSTLGVYANLNSWIGNGT